MWFSQPCHSGGTCEALKSHCKSKRQRLMSLVNRRIRLDCFNLSSHLGVVYPAISTTVLIVVFIVLLCKV